MMCVMNHTFYKIIVKVLNIRTGIMTEFMIYAKAPKNIYFNPKSFFFDLDTFKIKKKSFYQMFYTLLAAQAQTKLENRSAEFYHLKHLIK